MTKISQSKTPTDPPKRFISMLTDLGFKAIFGNLNDTTFLRKTIQILIQSDVPIKEVVIENTEALPLTKDSRGGFFDVTCTDEQGRNYVVEMQLTNFTHFIHRVKFYAFHRYNTLIKRGDYRFDDLKKMYMISFLGGKRDKSKEFHQICCLRNQHGEIFDDQITYITVELGKWNKKEFELETELDKLLYLMKYTHTATTSDPLPEFVEMEEWMQKALKELSLKTLTQEQRMAYEMELAKVGSLLGEMKRHQKALEELTEIEGKLIEKEEELIEKEEKLMEQKEELTEIEGKLIEKEEKLMEQKEELTEIEGKLIEKEEKLMEQKEELTEIEGKLIEKEEKLMEQKEELIEKSEIIQQQKQALLLAEQEKTHLIRTIWAGGSMTKAQIIELFNLSPEALDELLKK